MKEHFQTDPRDVEAAIGPGIGLCCFQVGPEVAREFGPYGGSEKTYLDLSRINREQLERVKVVYDAGLCTFCKEREFYSFRREKEAAGRMISYIGLAAD